MKKSIITLLQKLFSILLIVWILLSIGRTFFNLVSLVNELYLSIDQQNDQEYFEILSYTKDLKLNVNANKIMLNTDNGRAFFLIRYEMYPQKIYQKNYGTVPEHIQTITYQ